jgi:3-dehydroquinate dehydratase/shikimate dehydrogenase
MVEIRVDALKEIDRSALEALVKLVQGRGKSIIWTVRHQDEQGSFQGHEDERLSLLEWGDQLKVNFVDIEFKSRCAQEIQLRHAKKILSYHDFTSLPEDPSSIINEMREAGADVAKVAFNVVSTAECERVVALYKKFEGFPLVAIAMGEYGMLSRLFPAKLGMPWTYAAADEEGTAPGQFEVEELQTLYRFHKIGPNTRLFAVIGNPVGHSLSPQIHNLHYIEEGIDACYGKIRVDDMDALYKLAENLGIEGISVTVPHKEDLRRWMDEEHDLFSIGSANTLIRKNDRWQVRNTDIEAAISSIELLLDPSITNPKVLLLGSGGVSRSLAHGMKNKGWNITITNRTTSKAEDLSKEVQSDWIHWEDRSAHGFDVVVNGTSLGMTPNEDVSPLEFEGSHLGLIAFDTVYTPEYTLFLRSAKTAGAQIVTGREMFFRQAALQHAHWFDGAPPWESMENILRDL